MKKIKYFLLKNNGIKDTYIWNMISSMLMAFQSVIMLMVLTRTVGLVESGIFTIAYANANLFLTIGKYGMRNFQVSDVKQQFSFEEYKVSRVISFVTMMVVSIVYVLITANLNGYSWEKTQVVIWMCIFKGVDVLEDVYHGFYQQKNRLDVAAKSLTLRLASTIFVFAGCLIMLHNLLVSLIIATVFTSIFATVFIKWTFPLFGVGKDRPKRKNIISLMQLCFPLFAGSFLSFYIGNAPKYAIDSTLSDELQACYGFIAMPVFIIGLLNNFIFNPILYKMSVHWNERKVKIFLIKTIRQCLIVFAITLMCIIGAYILGIPVLSWIYNTDLAPYKTELIILLLGGGFLGLSGLLNAVITIIRYQKILMWGYAMVALIAFALSNSVVERYSMMGAAVLYTALMGILCVIFTVMFIIGIMINGQKEIIETKENL